MLVFRKKKMLARLEKEGRIDQICNKDYELMEKLDGKEATTYCWANIVNDEPLAWIADDSLPDGGVYINIADCD